MLINLASFPWGFCFVNKSGPFSIGIFSGSPGSHTGAIEAVGGVSDAAKGGGGAGGRVAVYHSTHLSMPPYRGYYNVYGGQPAPSSEAEAGASGTVYIFDRKTDHDTLRVDNKVNDVRAQ